MRPIKYIFFIFGLLALYAFSIPFAPAKAGVAERIGGDVAIRAFNSYADVEHGLEKRRSRGGGGRGRRTRPARKTRPRKKRPTKKRPSKKRPSKKRPSKKKSTKKPSTRKPKTKRPSTKNPKTKKTQKCKRNANGTKSCPLKKKACKRAGPGGSQDCGKTENYKVAEAAARKKGKTLKLNQAYMLKFMTNPGQNHHAKLIVGTVRKNKQGELDFEASASELVFRDRNLQGCEANFGAACKHRQTLNYDCQADMAKFSLAQYKFKGAASPEFADPQHFLQTGETILDKHPKYNIVLNNCRWHARRVANVAKLKKGEDPTVPERPSTPEPGSPADSEPETPPRRPLQVMNPDPDSDSD